MAVTMRDVAKAAGAGIHSSGGLISPSYMHAQFMVEFVAVA